MSNMRQLAFRTFEFEPQCELLYAQDVSGRAFPAYTVRKSGISSSQLQIARIVGSQTFDIGMLKLHAYSSKVDVSLHGHNTRMKLKSSFSATHVFDWPRYGDMHWKETLSGKLQLYDGVGRQLAAVKIGLRSCRLDILVPGDDYFVDVVIVTAVAKIRQQKKMLKDADRNATIIDALV